MIGESDHVKFETAFTIEYPKRRRISFARVVLIRASKPLSHAYCFTIFIPLSISFVSF